MKQSVFSLVAVMVLPIVVFGADAAKAPPQKRSYQVKDDIALIRDALDDQYGSSYSKFEVKTVYNPIFVLGNTMMKLQPVLKWVGGSSVRDYEAVYRVQYILNGKKMDCYAMVGDVRGSTEVVKIDVGTCNQDFSDFLSWTNEFTRFTNSVPRKAEPASNGGETGGGAARPGSKVQ